MAIGENIQKLLKKKRMSVAELSRKTGIASTSLYMAIKRDSNKMNTDSLEKIANALEIDVWQLVDTDHKTAENNSSLVDEWGDFYLDQDERREHEMQSDLLKQEERNIMSYWRDTLNPLLKILGYNGQCLFRNNGVYTLILQENGEDKLEIPLEDAQRIFSESLDVTNYLLRKSCTRLANETRKQLDDFRRSPHTTHKPNEQFCQAEKGVSALEDPDIYS